MQVEFAGQPHVVGIEEIEIRRPGHEHAAIASGGCSLTGLPERPAIAEISAAALGRGIGGPVVDHHHLERPERLSEDTVEGLGQERSVYAGTTKRP